MYLEILLILAGFMFLMAYVIYQQENSSSSTSENVKRGRHTAPRMRLLRWFPETNIPPLDYTVIDIETTGLDACTCDILEIGAIRCRGHQEIAKYHTYIRPDGPIHRAASEINHITWSMVSSAPRLIDVAEDFFRFVDKDVIVGFNVRFDIKFIQTRLGIEIRNDAFDVLDFVRNVNPSLDSYKLDDLRRYFSVGGKAHSALGDCQATARILEKCLESPEGQRYRDDAIKRQMEKEEQEAAAQKRRQEIIEKKERGKANSPPIYELNRISQQMTGAVNDYFCKVKEILLNHGAELNKLDENILRECNVLRISGYTFFGVKLNGILRYILLNVPLENIICNFTCTPSSLAEGEDSTRIYVSTPDDLDSLSEYIFASFQNTLTKCNRTY